MGPVVVVGIVGEYSRKYAISKIPIHKKETIHEYEDKLEFILKVCINEISKYTEKIIVKKSESSCIESINDMNELYISSIGAGGSDTVFEREHLDGPFFILPFFKVFRCLIGIQGNDTISNFFPEENREIVIRTNSFMAFDYNNDIHCIRHNKINCIVDEPRILMKLHYIVYPCFLPKFIVRFYKMIHVYYNSSLRKLFLMTQSSKINSQGSLLSIIVNGGTQIYCQIYKFCH